MKLSQYVFAAALAGGTSAAVHAEVLVNQAVSPSEVTAAQTAWCEALVGISTTADREGRDAAAKYAESVIDAAYGYQLGAVLFKPTLTTVPNTFRTTKEGALSYFVGGNPKFPEDSGFALKGWTGCQVDNAGVFIDGDSATTMGKVVLTGKDGKLTTVDKTWTFTKDDAGKLRIMVHHSSLEFAGK